MRSEGSQTGDNHRFTKGVEELLVPPSEEEPRRLAQLCSLGTEYLNESIDFCRSICFDLFRATWELKSRTAGLMWTLSGLKPATPNLKERAGNLRA